MSDLTISSQSSDRTKSKRIVRSTTVGSLLVNTSKILGFRHKVDRIEVALLKDPIDIARLRQLSISRRGLLNDDLRRRVWPKLLGVDDTDNIEKKPSADVLEKHRDYNQVVMDVNRSLKRFPPGMEETERLSMQDQLVDCIMRVLVKHNQLHYYQGYHDICVTFLLIAGEDIAYKMIEKLSLNHLRDFMDSNMDRTKHMLSYLYPILNKANPELSNYLERAELGTIFCLSWLITWFGHTLNDIKDIVRLYDFFIACHPLMPIYLAAAIVLHREPELLVCEGEMCYLHSLLSKIPDRLPFEQLISKAGDLYLQYPPTQLANEAIAQYRNSIDEAQKRRLEAVRRQKISTFQKFMRRSRLALVKQNRNNIYLKVTVWTLSAVVSATVVALITGAKGWDYIDWEHWSTNWF